MTNTANSQIISVYFDGASDSDNPGWVLRYTTAPDDKEAWCEEILKTTDPDDEAGALAEAEAWMAD